MNSRHIGAFLGLLATAPFGWLACNSLLGIEEPELRVDGGGSTGGDTAVSDTAGGGCVLAQPPSAPTEEPPSSDPNQSFVSAVRRINLSVAPPNENLGYDLDGRCTCPSTGGAPESCKPVVPKAPEHCDGKDGRDVSVNLTVVPTLLSTPGFSSDDLNNGFERGLFGLIAMVRNYNGTPNDREVEVSLFLSPGIAGATGTPKWDGTDKFDFDPASVDGTIDAGTPTSLYVDKTAYVRDGVLVASKLNNVRLNFGFGVSALKLEVSSTSMTARITKTSSGKLTLTEGTIVGRLPTAALLKAVGPLPVPPIAGGADGGVVCNSGFFYSGVVKPQICRAADLSSNPARDPVGSAEPTASCDAVSFALRFDNDPVQFGGPRAAPAFPSACGPSWGTDDCSK